MEDNKVINKISFLLKKNNTPRKSDFAFVFAVGGLIGAIVFILIYGVGVINPTNINWVYQPSGGDRIQHYIGWIYYRDAPWTIPLGVVDNILYQVDGATVINFDSIPIFAVFFKILSPILPENFQYFGIWEFCCYILQGGFSALIIRYFIPYNLISAMSSFIFVTAPFFAVKVFGHSALSGHFIILAAWCLYVYSDKVCAKFYQKVLLWSVVCSVAILIHPYLVIINGAIMATYSLNQLLTTRNKIYFALPLLCILFTALVFALFGGFYASDSGLNNGLLGQANMNLDAWWNSRNTSAYLPPFKDPDIYFPSEGHQYPGLGIHILSPFLIAYIFMKIKELLGKSKDERRKKLKSLIPIVCLFICALIHATMPNIYWGDNLIFSFSLPQPIYKIFDIFQGNGRLFWGVSYALMTFYIVATYRVINCICKKQIAIFIVICLACVVQGMDHQNFFKNPTYKNVEQVTQDETILPKSDFWDEVFTQVSYMDFIYGYENGITQGLVIKAKDYNVVPSMTAVARRAVSKWVEFSIKTYEDLMKGIVRNDKIYVIDTQSLAGSLIGNSALNVYYTDGFYVALSKDIVVSEEYIPLKQEQMSMEEYCEYIMNSKNYILMAHTYNPDEQIDDTMNNILGHIGCEQLKDADGLEFALAIDISSKQMEYAVDSEFAQLSFTKNVPVGDIVFPADITVTGITNVVENQNIIFGFAKNNKQIWSINGQLSLMLYNKETGIIESVAWYNSSNPNQISINRGLEENIIS